VAEKRAQACATELEVSHLVHQLEIVRLFEGALLEHLEQVTEGLDAVQVDELLHPHHRLLPNQHGEVLQVVHRRLNVEDT
jgi:hypothetical protein